VFETNRKVTIKLTYMYTEYDHSLQNYYM